MTKLELVKTGVGIIVSFGVGGIVTNLIKSTSPSNMKALTKFCVAVSGFVLASYLGDAASKHVEDSIDSAVDTVKKITNGDLDQVIEEEEA